MSSPCSDPNGGCASCALPIYIAVIAVTVNPSINSFSCGDTNYKNYSTNSMANYNFLEFTPPYEPIGFQGSSSSNNNTTSTIENGVDDYGNIYSLTLTKTNSSSRGDVKDISDSILEEIILQATSNSLTLTRQEVDTSTCPASVITIDDGSQSECTLCYYGGQFEEPPGCPPPYPPPCWAGLSIPSPCNPEAACPVRKCSTNETGFYYGDMGRATTTTSNTETYSEPIDDNVLLGLASGSVSKKIRIFENNESQNCDGDKCGTGEKDDCWSTGSFGIVEKPSVCRAKYKVYVEKEPFKKSYKSISGQLILYIPSEQDIEQGRTPCCNDDFSGTILQTNGFSINGSQTFKKDYVSSDAGNSDSSSFQNHIGEGVGICIKITAVSFL